jgi:hypothetical protein
MSVRMRILVSIATMAGGLAFSSASAIAAAPSATGGGSTALFTFGFTAQSHNDGTVSGNGEFNYSGTPIHVRVDCLQVIGNQAYLSGQTTEQTDGFSEGTEILWGVQDNSATGLPDLISNVYYSPAPPLTCRTFHAPPTFPLTSGNVVVRPS